VCVALINYYFFPTQVFHLAEHRTLLFSHGGVVPVVRLVAKQAWAVATAAEGVAACFLVTQNLVLQLQDHIITLAGLLKRGIVSVLRWWNVCCVFQPVEDEVMPNST